MFVVTTAILVALFLAYLEREGKMKHGLEWGLALVTLLGCIHYDFGSDYMEYYNNYKNVEMFDFNIRSILDGELHRDPGWTFIEYAFKHIGGFFMMVAVLNLIQNFFVYRFIKTEVDKEWQLLALFIFLCTTSLYMYEFTMMRQSFVVFVFLGLWPLIKEKKWYYAAIVLFLCSFVHASAKFLIPFAFWGFFPVQKSKVASYAYLVVFIALWFSANTLNNILLATMDFAEVQMYFERYGGVGNYSLSIGLGFVLKMIPLIVSFYAMFVGRNLESTKKILLYIGTVSFMVTPFTTYLPLLGRFGIYFDVFTIGALPIAFKAIENLSVRKILLSMYILITFYDYIIFYSNDIWKESFMEYHTIFSQI